MEGLQIVGQSRELAHRCCYDWLWLTVAQRKSFNAIPHNYEKRCKVDASYK